MKKIFILVTLVVLLSGCNKEIFDTTYTFKKAICNYNNDKFTLNIKSWTDYDGEQLQIKDKKGKTYLISANNCYLTD